MQRTGKVKFFLDDAGYGFVRDDRTGNDVFLHASELIDPRVKPERGAMVEFTLDPSRNRALKVKPCE